MEEEKFPQFINIFTCLIYQEKVKRNFIESTAETKKTEMVRNTMKFMKALYMENKIIKMTNKCVTFLFSKYVTSHFFLIDEFYGFVFICLLVQFLNVFDLTPPKYLLALSNLKNCIPAML